MSDSWDVVDLLAEIADVGRDPVRGGYSRHVFEPAELELRAWFTRRAEQLGLTVEPDRNGNIWAHWGEPGPGTVGTGSHLDSVPGGGAYDGPLGVASALSAVAGLKADGFVPVRPVAVIAFAEEEGSRFGIACLGSKLMTGAVDPAAIAARADTEGVTFAQAADAAGVDSAGIGRDDERLSSLGCFIELHVEQGRALTDIGAPVAVASAILAHGRWRLAFHGEGNHAGATPMADRRDPVVAASAAILAARDVAAAADKPGGGVSARATVGRIVPVPGGTNVIASRVDAWLDVRGDTDPATRALVAEISAAMQIAAGKEGCRTEIIRESYLPEVTFDPGLRDSLRAALAAVPEFGEVPVLATGAGHDAGVLAAELPTAMLFVRNPTGVSHAPAESSSDDDCRAGAAALATVLAALAG
ncbi:allantoate amidohydrolase [Trebonia kvetii]|uniref:Allantoate amidohydrolase n=1 Tax=Trebonia kvetii TaxID=2480626 RepID=A0A6P2BQU5_9ACTN|nr:allantoate amidohydrolase [Trebonia kvetii]TVZ01037.1 allantoate amidohydrolase [Trebonia kvetii]